MECVLCLCALAVLNSCRNVIRTMLYRACCPSHLPGPLCLDRALACPPANPTHTHTHTLPTCRALLLGGDYFLGAVIAATLTKLVLRLRALRALPPASINRLSADVMQLIAGMLRLGESGAAVTAGLHPIDADSRDRMATCLRTLAGRDEALALVWLEECRAAFATLITDKQQREAAEAKQEVRRGRGRAGEGGR